MQIQRTIRGAAAIASKLPSGCDDKKGRRKRGDLSRQKGRKKKKGRKGKGKKGKRGISRVSSLLRARYGSKAKAFVSGTGGVFLPCWKLSELARERERERERERWSSRERSREGF
jgi:hypothetical protein